LLIGKDHALLASLVFQELLCDLARVKGVFQINLMLELMAENYGSETIMKDTRLHLLMKAKAPAENQCFILMN
jgi:hypothetical protein